MKGLKLTISSVPNTFFSVCARGQTDLKLLMEPVVTRLEVYNDDSDSIRLYLSTVVLCAEC